MDKENNILLLLLFIEINGSSLIIASLGRNREFSLVSMLSALILQKLPGIPRNITFLDNDFKQEHPQMQIDKKSDSPDEGKSISDSKSLKPVLTDFFNLHPDSKPHTFLGDSIFDEYATYPMLLDNFNFKRYKNRLKTAYYRVLPMIKVM